MNNKGADQTVRVCRLVSAFVVPMQQYQVFLYQVPFMRDYMFIMRHDRVAFCLKGYKYLLKRLTVDVLKG